MTRRGAYIDTYMYMYMAIKAVQLTFFGQLLHTGCHWIGLASSRVGLHVPGMYKSHFQSRIRTKFQQRFSIGQLHGHSNSGQIQVVFMKLQESWTIEV